MKHTKKKKKASGSGNPFFRAGSPAEAIFETGKQKIKQLQRDRAKRDRAKRARSAPVSPVAHREQLEQLEQEAEPLSFRAGKAIGAARRGLLSIDPRQIAQQTRERFRRALDEDDVEQEREPMLHLPRHHHGGAARNAPLSSRNAPREVPRNASRNAPPPARNASARSAFGAPGSSVGSFDAQAKLEGHTSAAIKVLDHEIGALQRKRAEIREAVEEVDLDALVQLGVISIPQSRELARSLRR